MADKSTNGNLELFKPAKTDTIGETYGSHLGSARSFETIDTAVTDLTNLPPPEGTGRRVGCRCYLKLSRCRGYGDGQRQCRRHRQSSRFWQNDRNGKTDR